MTNEQLITRFYHEMWDPFDESLIPLLLTPDFRFRGSLGNETRGHAQFADYMRLIQRAFPDFTNHVEETITQSDRTFARLTYRGTHHGEALGIPPTGRRIEYAGAAVFHFRDDRKIAATWVLGDVWTLLRQLRGEVATNGTTA
jgi:steroid delta-isomerase-like uncharacterized protein